MTKESPWDRRLLAFILFWSGIGYLHLFVTHPDPRVEALLTNGVYWPLVLGAAFFAWRAAGHPLASVPLRKAWGTLAWGFLTYAVGDFLWFWYGGILQIDPFPSPADLFYLGSYPILFRGLMYFPSAPSTRNERIKLFLDAGVVVVVGWLFIYHLIVQPVTSAGLSDPWSIALALAYPLGDVILIVGVAAILLTGRRVTQAGVLATLALGMSAIVAADLSFAWQELRGVYQWGGVPDALWTTSWLVLALAGYVQIRRYARGEREDLLPSQLMGWLADLLPVGAIAAGYGLLISASHGAGSNTVLNILYLGGVAYAAHIFRQMITHRENVRLLTEQARDLGEARFRALVQHSTDLITIVDAGGTILYQSPSSKSTLGYLPEAVVGTQLVTYVHPGDVEGVTQTLGKLAQNEDGLSISEWHMRHRNGKWIDVECAMHNLQSDSNIGGIVLTMRDVTDRHTLERQIRHQAFHDALTNLANRALFRERVEEALAQQRMSGQPLSILFIDLDNFKTINDSLGHGVGDQLLVWTAQRLLALRPPGATVARLGGDEFAILYGGADEADAEQLAARVVEACRQPYICRDSKLNARTSVGVVTSHRPESADALLRNADLAMYAAKDKGKDGYVFYEPDMHSVVLQRMKLQGELAQALDQGQFQLFYQPVVNLTTGGIHGFEALLRWNHPIRGLVPPGAFIDVAEETDLIIPIGRWVLETALRQVKRWQECYPEAEPLTINVNLSAQQLRHADLPAHVAEALSRTGMDPSRVTLEVTESKLAHKTDILVGNLTLLKGMGVHFAIDDFGAGYASIEYLRWFPADQIKIDRSFIGGPNAEREAALLKGIVGLASAAGMVAVAEGLEHRSQVEHMVQLECPLGQGYFFGRPVPEDEAERMLAQQMARRQAG